MTLKESLKFNIIKTHFRKGEIFIYDENVS